MITLSEDFTRMDRSQQRSYLFYMLKQHLEDVCELSKDLHDLNVQLTIKFGYKSVHNAEHPEYATIYTKNLLEITPEGTYREELK